MSTRFLATSFRSCANCSWTSSRSSRARRGFPSGFPNLVRVSVEDGGPGIPARERERVWRRYYRLARDRESAVAGTGIGLAVVRELTLLQGGRAYVEEGAAGGARFVIELEAAAA